MGDTNFAQAFGLIREEKNFDKILELSNTLSSKELLKEAAKLQLTGNPDVQVLIQQKAQEEAKGRTRESLIGSEGKEFGGVSPEGNQFGGRTPDTRIQGGMLESLLSAKSRNESSDDGGLLGGKQPLSNKIDVEPESEAWKLLLELPRGNRRVLYNRLIDENENYNITDLRNDVTKELASIAKHKEVLRKENQVEGTKVSADKRKLGMDQNQRAENLFGDRVGKSQYYDKTTGEMVDRIDPMRPQDFSIGTSNIPGQVTRHISENVGGAGSRSKEVQEMTKAVTNIDKQISDLSKSINNPNADIELIMQQIKQLRARRTQLSSILPETSDRQKFNKNVFSPDINDPLGVLGQ